MNLRFVTAAYVPQLLCVYAPFAPFGSLAFVLMIILWAAFGWLVGLTVMVAVYFAVVCTELGRLQMTVFRQQVASHDEELVLFVGAEVVRVGEKDVEGRMLVVIGTKLVLENLLQLWLQSSYLSLSFETMDSFARWQAMASIGVGLLVAGSSQKPRLRSSDAKAADSKHFQNLLVMTHPLPQVAKGSSCRHSCCQFSWKTPGVLSGIATSLLYF